LAAGRYGDLSVKSRATLTLAAADYAFSAISIEPGARIVFLGPTRIAVHGDLHFLGTTSGPAPVLEFTGARQIFLEASFRGIVRAPQSSLTLGGTSGQSFRGEFFARSILVRSSETVVQDGFDCTQ